MRFGPSKEKLDWMKAFRCLLYGKGFMYS
jgi:hypothetical protein